jgi:predicted nucleic acid-binding protein
VILLDAYALVAFLISGPATPQVRSMLREGSAAVATTNLAEALDVSERVRGVPIARAMEILAPLFEGTLTTIPLDQDKAQRAAEIRVAHYDRARRPISLADAVVVASAGSGDRIATADPDLLEVAVAEGHQVVALPGEGSPILG